MYLGPNLGQSVFTHQSK